MNEPDDRSRREFLRQAGLGSGFIAGQSLLGPLAAAAETSAPRDAPAARPPSAVVEPGEVPVSVRINAATHELRLDPRVTLLDLLRERMQLTGTKKGCDHGQCGACTVLLDGRRVNSCLTLAVVCDGRAVTTIEGLSAGPGLHPLQAAFIEHDGFQCGYCTPGQICSAAAMLDEARAGWPSVLTAPGSTGNGQPVLSDGEIRERMSGNICRCGAYPNIVSAIRRVAADANLEVSPEGAEGTPL